MLNQKLNLVVVSDIHLGHRKTPTEHIIANLKKAIPDTKESNDIDMIIFPGDVYDRLLNHPQGETYEIQEYFGFLLRMCKRRDIVLRVLEGTPSHDWKQPRHIEVLNDGGGVEADVRYIPRLYIEHNERFNIDILYIPDEWSADNDDTWKQVVQLMSDHGLEKVDFVVMHGMFPYQLPAHLDLATHNPERYMSITRHYIFCGHVHTPSTYGPIQDPNAWPDGYGSIIVPGSFDRLRHNEEEPKGHWRLTVDPNGEDYVEFHPNVDAKTYITVECFDLDIESMLEKVDSAIKDVEAGSHISLAGTADDPINAGLDLLRRKYPGLNWTTNTKTTKVKDPKETLNDMRATFESKPINENTIYDMISNELKELGADPEQIKRCHDNLRHVL